MPLGSRVVHGSSHLRLLSKIIGCDENISRREIIEEGENAVNYLDKLLSTCDIERKAWLCRIKRDVQEQQHEIDKSVHIQKLVSELEKEQTDDLDSPFDDKKDSQSRPTPGVAMETISFQNDNHSSGVTDEVDSGKIDKARVSHLVCKFSGNDGRKEGLFSGNEQKEHEVSEVRHSVSWKIRNFEKMTSYSDFNLSGVNKNQPAPYVTRKVLPVPSQDKKQGSSVDTFKEGTSKEKGMKEKSCSKSMSTSRNKTSLQCTPFVANDVPIAPSQDKKQGSSVDTFKEGTSKEKGIEQKSCSKSLSTSRNKPSLQCPPFVANDVPIAPSQDKKPDSFDDVTTLDKEKPKIEKDDVKDICVDAKYVSRLVRRFEDLAK